MLRCAPCLFSVDIKAPNLSTMANDGLEAVLRLKIPDLHEEVL